MPYVRSSRGSRSQFLPTKVANTVSKAYAYAFAAKAARLRPKVLAHTDAIVAQLTATLGNDPSSEWPRAKIREAIEQELRLKANMEVYEAYLEQNPITKALREERRTAERGWGGFGPMPTAGQANEEIDPTWNITVMREGGVAVPSTTSLAKVGTAFKRTVRRVPKKTGWRPVQVSCRRSMWFRWWRDLSSQAGHPLDLALFEKSARRRAEGPLALDSQGWWDFWQEVLFDAMRSDPRIFGLLRVAQQRVNRAKITSQDWLDGSGLNELPEEPHRLSVLSDTPPNVLAGLYRSMWVENTRRLLQSGQVHPAFGTAYDLMDITTVLQPERDDLIDWRGHQHLLNGGCLWPLPEGHVWTVTGSIQVAPGAFEPPQWAWLRLAMALALHEPNPREAAERFYDSISTLALLPSETMLRQAGEAKPNFLEDKAARVQDRFESIYDTIFRTAVGTKWTGTVALDWREVRAAGSPIDGGRRRSNGVMPFLRQIHDALDAQGREGADRPVTVSLPLWHREADSFIDVQQAVAPRLQTVLLVSDLFMRRVQEGGSWTFFDPAFFPEVVDGSETGYLAAETAAAERKRKNPRACRTMRAERVWRKMLRAMAKGAPFVTFEDADKPFAPFPTSAPGVHGVDGVGSLPLPKGSDRDPMPWVAWPSMAINLKMCLGADGLPILERLSNMVECALRMLDDAITASVDQHTPTVLQHRSVCLGAVGFYDAVIGAAGSSGETDEQLVQKWMAGLAEMWAGSVVHADQVLRRERGAAPAWTHNRASDAQVFDPMGGVDRLRVQRLGSLGMRPEPGNDWTTSHEQRNAAGQRSSVHTIWAPFSSLAAIGGVSPGGVGSLRPVERVEDEQGRHRWVPTPLLLQTALRHPDDLNVLRNTLRFPMHPKRWPASMSAWSSPDAEGWRGFLQQAALIRPWVDQGVSLTLPEGLSMERLSTLLQQAWWMGLSNVRFEALAPKRIDETLSDDEQDTDDGTALTEDEDE